MGIHSDGDYYRRWTEQANKEKEESTVQQRHRRQYDRPVWEEEGNFVSLLLGRRKNSGEPLLFENVFDYQQRGGSLLHVFQYTFKTTLILGSYVCRWASVRGSLPQPLVVLGVATAGLCAPRKRWRAMLLALILLRTAGEVVHSSIYGNDGWEDDDEVEEIDDDLAPRRNRRETFEEKEE